MNKLQALSLVTELNSCLFDHRGGWKDEPALRQFLITTSSLRSGISFIHYQISEVGEWARILYSDSKWKHYPDEARGVWHFLHHSLTSLRTLLNARSEEQFKL